MKRVISLAIGAVAMVALNGCNPVGNGSVSDSNGQRSYIYTTDLNQYGYKISGWDTLAGKQTDLCFDGNGHFVYGRGNEYFDGTYQIKNASDIAFKDNTDGGSYILYTNGEIDEGNTYDFGNTLPNNNIRVDSITATSNISLCKGLGKKMRVFSTIRKSI